MGVVWLNEEVQEFIINNFSGGLNRETFVDVVGEVDAEGFGLQDNELVELVNAKFYTSGGVYRRPGSQKVGEGTGLLVGVYSFTSNIHDNYFITEDGIFQEDGTQVTTSGDPYPTIDQGTGLEAFIVSYENLVYIVGENVDGVVSIDYDGGNFTLDEVDTDPRCRAVIFKDRMFFTRTDEPDTIWFSDLGDFATVGMSSFLDVSGDNDLPVTAIIPFNDSLFIFKKDSVHQLSVQGDPENWVLRLIATVGANNHFCVANINNTLYVMNDEGFFRTDGIFFENIGQKVFSDTALEQFTFQANAIALIPYGNELLITHHSDDLFYFDPVLNAFSRWEITGGHVNVLVRSPVNGFVFFEGIGDANNEFYHFSSVDDDHGGAVELQLTTKWFDLGSTVRFKDLRFAFAEVRGASVDIAVQGIHETLAQDTIDLGDSEHELKLVKLETPRRVRKFRFVISVTSTSPFAAAAVFSLGAVFSYGNFITQEVQE